jgi:hypothetical protein
MDLHQNVTCTPHIVACCGDVLWSRMRQSIRMDLVAGFEH